MVVDGRCAHLMSDRMFFVDGLLEERVLMENQKAKKDTRSRCEWNEPGGGFCCALVDLLGKSSSTLPLPLIAHSKLQASASIATAPPHCTKTLNEWKERAEIKGHS